jgi:hypothetical protein
MERLEKQTAVEYFYRHYILEMEQYGEIHIDLLNKLYERSKSMEKEQIIEAHKQSSIESGFEESAEDWANEYWERNYGV